MNRAAKFFACFPMLLIILLYCSQAGGAAAAKSTTQFRDISTYEGKASIESAAADGWIDGYPDGNFYPERSVTRWEYVKMLLSATGITPGSEYAQRILDYTTVAPEILALTDHSWVCSEGWARIAFAFGLVDINYFGNKQLTFPPHDSFTRYEAALISVRMLGLVYPASQKHAQFMDPRYFDGMQADTHFTDLLTMPSCDAHIIDMAVKKGLIGGYTDEKFFPLESLSRADAVSMVWMLLDEMEVGTDTAIEAHISVNSADIPIVPIQRVGNMLYIPADILFSVHPTITDIMWDADTQIYTVNIPDASIQFQAGSQIYKCYASQSLRTTNTLPKSTRILYGQLMIPAFDFSTNLPTLPWLAADWDSENNLITLSFTNNSCSTLRQYK